MHPCAFCFGVYIESDVDFACKRGWMDVLYDQNLTLFLQNAFILTNCNTVCVCECKVYGSICSKVVAGVVIVLS